ncbi:DUF1553 domain-containing protein [bacterium]|nr:DUF1553 domain-containing protein [bacterium]
MMSNFHAYSRCIVALALLLLVRGQSAAELQAEELPSEQIEFFEAKIRPVLIEHCYECHNSLDSTEGGLAVDYRAAFLKGGDSGAALVPGKPEKSSLLPILRHEVDGMEMPSGGPKLSDEVIADFEKWISLGAPDPRSEKPTAEALAAATSWETVLERRKQWWSFQPIATPQVPQVKNQSWSTHPIDKFILNKLEEQGLEPTNQAAPSVLVRRLFFTLIGLPPTPAEAIEWSKRLTSAASDEMRNQVTEELIDSLMARPQFGEKWARHWMDWIRYAESHGSEGDPAIPDAWRYRDYLIRAWNDDVPYDQLVREHVAGDLLENPRVNAELGINESAIGPAHWRMVFHGFSPTDALDERVRFTDDQINVFSKAFLGLTVSCARCHNHKFDPISQADYYALFGILNSCRPGRTVINTRESDEQIRQQLSQLKQQIRHSLAEEWLAELEELPARLKSLPENKDSTSLLAPWFSLQSVNTPDEFAYRWNSLAEQQLAEKEPSPAAKVSWDLSTPDDYSQWFRGTESLPEQPHTAGEFAVASEGSRILKGIYPGGVYSHPLSPRSAARLTSPDIPLDGKYHLWIRARGEGKATARFAVQNYPRRGNLFPVQQLKPTWTWHRFDLSYWQGDSVHVELTTALDAPLLVTNEPSSWFGLSDVRIQPADAPAPKSFPNWLNPLFEQAGSQAPRNSAELADLYRRTLATAIRDWNTGSLNDAQAELLDRSLAAGLLTNDRNASPSTASLLQHYRNLEKQLETPIRVPGVDETVGHDQALYVRGNHKQPAETIPRRFLESIDAEPYQSELSGRRELAEDLLRADNPLTRRVIVNRLWLHLFGKGLVGTPDNFGRLGQTPTHPQLLDWLANNFSEKDWSLKQMIRLMVTTKTWRLASTAGESTVAADPDNQWLSRAHVRRLEAEAIRDSMLATAGVLDLQPYGPPVNGATPRRSLYVRVIRNRLDPFLRSFDFPEPFSATGRRNATNVPAQSLMLMNDEQIRTAARNWSKRTLSETSLSDKERIQQMFLTAFSRPATPREMAMAEGFLQQAASTRERLSRDYGRLQQQLTDRQQEITNILSPVRNQLERSQESSPAANSENVVQPLAQWEFAQGIDDTLHGLKGTLHGNARVSETGLTITPQGYLVTAPLETSISAKTLEAWVQLDNLKQQGAGVMSLQTPRGQVFDAIVFGERSPQQWLAGSDHWNRTQPFSGPAEAEAVQRPVHLAIVYHQDGTIQGYRYGQPYGKAYQSNGPQEFQAGNSVVSFGVRHLPAGGNKMLSGRILRARLYDKALTSEQIQASFRTAPTVVTEQEVRNALTTADRERLIALERQIIAVEQQLKNFPSVPEAGPSAVWADLAQALFTFQEFIYLQ